ncbi:Cupin domain-containing protein [Saccharopolyspora antimicrobica]|uniref:Cupin domain-containing protein n=1 Tax=Saccharopolyspora antimicrobica TaxID=455193 RepID=A0A1I4SD04_9PSEU|nr:cupin domain-containing protein [Saccharopolyspora antimicrobica]RKT87695.1 Cupin domain-containing protein [Saccharopolyspora antimicrobica]SFM62396.1 Cupin domain-containing protein [Saccharopolyspora antimicrobica]
MSYPEPRYFGEHGEINASFRPATAEPEFVAKPVGADADDPRATSYHYLSTTASTGGEYGLYRVDMGPESTGPSTHFHKAISESFFILSGTMRLFDGERWINATSGDYLYVPVGGLHAFRNESGEPASMLMLFAPGAPREGYFEGLPELASLSEEERREFVLRHDSFFV